MISCVSAEDEEIDRLYGLPLDEFTEARNALSRRFRDEGQRAIAARIKELAKPSAPASLVNRLVRERRPDVDRLLELGEQLQEAQRRAVGGGERDFAELDREHTKAVRGLVGAAGELARSGGGAASQGVLQRVGSTLRAASGTRDGREALARGRLTEEVEPVGFEALAGVPVSAGRGGGEGRSKADERRARRVKAAEEELRELEQTAKGLEREARDAEQAAERKRVEADEARKRADRAEQSLRSLRTDRDGSAS
ncbi:MAG: hypothetical protein QOE36_1650 [Gaiellaceae bacterium]|jgi:hypothetical protein|nr:hypothetical protein [Gaiellaceae bacterium]